MVLSLGTAPTVTAGQLTWGTDGGALKTEPTTAYKNAGYLATVPPSVHAMNFWMNGLGAWLNYLATGINTINTGKLDKAGDTLTGNLLASLQDSTSNQLGNSTTRFRAFLGTLNVYTSLVMQASTTLNFASTTRFVGSFIPQADASYDIGLNNVKLRRIYTAYINGGVNPTTLAVTACFSETDFDPATNGTLDLGATSNIWANCWCYNFRFHPTNPLAVMSRFNGTLALAYIEGGAGTLQSGHQINIGGTPGVTGTGRSGLGTYEVFFLQPLYNNATPTARPAIVVTPMGNSSASTARTFTYEWITTQRLTIRFFTTGSSPALADPSAFSLAVIGSTDF